MNGKHQNYSWNFVLIVALLFMINLPKYAIADGGTVYLRGISTRHLAESGELGLSVWAADSVGDGLSIKPADLQIQVNNQPVEAYIDRDSRTRHIFVVDYSLSPENKRWINVTETTANIIDGIVKNIDSNEEISVIWAGEENHTENMGVNALETMYRSKRESVKTDTTHIYDAIGEAIDIVEEGLDGYDYYNIYVLTDGFDNGSRATLDHLRKLVQDGDSPLSIFISCYFNGSRAIETGVDAESKRKALLQFTTYIDGAYNSFDVQRSNELQVRVGNILNEFANMRYGLLDVRVRLNDVLLDRKNGQTEIYVGLITGGTAKKKIIYLDVDELPLQTDASSLDDYDTIIAEKDAQIDTLVSGAALKDAEISALKKTIEEQSSKINPLETELEEKTAKIKNLETDIGTKNERIDTMETENKKMTDKNKELEKKVADQVERIENLEADIAENEAKMESMEDSIVEKTSKIETLEADATEKATRIETLENDVEKKDAQITTLATELSAKITQINNMQVSLNDRDEKIELMTTTISEKKTQIESLEADILGKDIKIEKMLADNRAQTAQLQIFKQKILEDGIAAGYDGNKSLQVIVPTKDYVIEHLVMIPDIAVINAVTIDNDPNGQLGKEGQYIDQIFFSSPLVNPEYTDNLEFDVIKAGTVCGGSIEVYRTIEDAMKRNEHLAYYDGSSSSSGSHIVVGTLVIRTSSELALVDQRKLESEIIEALTIE